MKQFLLAAAMLTTVSLTAQVRMPQPSTLQTISQDFGLGKVELSYSRPNLKNRKAFGKQSLLAPVGEVWRTGANNATTLNFTDQVIINGVNIPAGKYGLLSIPGEKTFTIILTKDLNVTSPAAYKKENDVVRVDVPVMKMKDNMETFTMQFANVQYESMELHIMWDKNAVSLPITTQIKDRIKADMDKAMAGDKPPFSAAANFYHEWMKDYPKALEYITKAIDANKKAFWLYLTKARIQKDMGDKVGAKASAEACIELAKEAKNDDYVRMSNELIKSL
jgi:tetratricopeptide (TPR) repeat protein